MRAESSGVTLTAKQSRIADAGIKALMPVAGDKTMLELILDSLSAAGFDHVCLVIGPEHSAIRDFCSDNNLDVRFAIQVEPRGTADAVLAASDVEGPVNDTVTVCQRNRSPVTDAAPPVTAGHEGGDRTIVKPTVNGVPAVPPAPSCGNGVAVTVWLPSDGVHGS